MMKQAIAIVSIVFVSLLVVRPLLEPGVPLTHDGQNHLARMANYYLAVKQGQIPPRWAPNLNNGFGYPVFNFNYPLANIIALVPIVIGLSIEATFKLILVIAVLFSGVGMWAFLQKHFSFFGAFLGAIVYVLAPYQLLLLYVRGVVGETLALALLPWLLWMLERYYLKPSRNLFWLLVGLLGAFFLSHNIIVLFLIPVLASYLLVLVKFKWRELGKFTGPVIIAMLLVSFFWVPAILEKQYTVLDQVRLSRDFPKHFPTIGQLIYSAWGYKFSEPGPVDGLSPSLGWLSWLALILSLMLVLKKQKPPGLVIFSLVVLVVTLILMQRWSEPIWGLVKVFKYIQFPWRLLFLTTLMTPILVAWISERVFSRKFWLLVGVLVVVSGLSKAKADSRFSHGDFHWFSFSLTTSVLDENRPKWFKKTEVEEKWIKMETDEEKKVVVDLMEKAKIEILKWTGSYHQYWVESDEEVFLAEKTAYFPGWEMKVDGKEQRIDFETKELPGLVTTKLSPGRHEVVTRFTQNTWPRRVGNGLSLLGGILLVGLITRKRWLFR